jgi:hypothetical protein
MKKLSMLGLVAVLALTIAPAAAKTTSAQAMMPRCKGRIVVVNTSAHVYYPATKTHVTSKKMVMMCEATARARGYHMQPSTMVIKSHAKMKAAAPAVNPSGAMNSDKGASPNPMNNQNGVHTTANPSPTPTP